MTTAGSLNKKLRGRACVFCIYNILFFFSWFLFFQMSVITLQVQQQPVWPVGCGEGNKALEAMRSVWEINWGMHKKQLSFIKYYF